MLKEAGINFLLKTKDIPEDYPPSLPPMEVPEFLAKLKASAFTDDINSRTVLCADTVVLIDGQILGKPENAQHACGMLQQLSGKMHLVITGVCIRNRNREVTFSDVTEVYFRKLSAAAISDYVGRYKPFDKAGAYGIQEWIGLIGVERINGSYFNVMGLPIHRVVEALEQFDIRPFA